jgi:hypothetical protein
MFPMSKIALSRGLLLLSIAVWIAPFHNALVVPLSAAKPKESLTGVFLPRVVLDGDNKKNYDGNAELVNLGAEIGSGSIDKRTMVIFGTHAGDFNMIEYLQKIRFSFRELKEKGNIDRILCVVNGAPDQIKLLAGLLDIPADEIKIDFFADPTGEAGRCFGVDRGFRPDDDSLSPFAKQFCTGIGIGPPWMTLPAVLPGYTGNPNGKRDWIEASLKQGQLAGRWPSVLELDDNADNEKNIVGNKFDEAPLGLGSWGRRPFELATLRLQSLIGIQIQHWSELKPVDDRCLTQLGGCTVVESDGTAIYSWVDKGLCHVPDMDDLLEVICKE